MARVPLYKAAETEMLRRIEAGDWPVGLRLPNEFGLADEFGVSQGTMRRALMTLESMGFLQRKPGRGTIVAKPETKSAQSNPSPGFDRLRDASGTPPDFEVFRARATTRGATEAEAALFGTARLAGLERTMRLDGERCALDEITLPESLTPALPEDAPVHLPDILAALGHPVAEITDHLSAAVTSMGESVALSVDRYSPLLVLTRTARDADGAAFAQQVLRLVPEHAGYAITLGR